MKDIVFVILEGEISVVVIMGIIMVFDVVNMIVGFVFNVCVVSYMEVFEVYLGRYGVKIDVYLDDIK